MPKTYSAVVFALLATFGLAAQSATVTIVPLFSCDQGHDIAKTFRKMVMSNVPARWSEANIRCNPTPAQVDDALRKRPVVVIAERKYASQRWTENLYRPSAAFEGHVLWFVKLARSPLPTPVTVGMVSEQDTLCRQMRQFFKQTKIEKCTFANHVELGQALLAPLDDPTHIDVAVIVDDFLPNSVTDLLAESASSKLMVFDPRDEEAVGSPLPSLSPLFVHVPTADLAVERIIRNRFTPSSYTMIVARKEGVERSDPRSAGTGKTTAQRIGSAVEATLIADTRQVWPEFPAVFTDLTAVADRDMLRDVLKRAYAEARHDVPADACDPRAAAVFEAFAEAAYANDMQAVNEIAIEEQRALSASAEGIPDRSLSAEWNTRLASELKKADAATCPTNLVRGFFTFNARDRDAAQGILYLNAAMAVVNSVREQRPDRAIAKKHLNEAAACLQEALSRISMPACQGASTGSWVYGTFRATFNPAAAAARVQAWRGADYK